MAECVALLRGINVGRAKRVPMAELRDVLESMGCSRVRTLLNTGNALFGPPDGPRRELSGAIAAAIERRFGFPVPVLVHTAGEIEKIIAENTLPQAEREPSKCLVAFVSSRRDLDRAKPLLTQSWGAEQIAIGSRAVYLWCATGIADSVLLQAFGREMASPITTRNWATVLKIQAAFAPGKSAV